MWHWRRSFGNVQYFDYGGVPGGRSGDLRGQARESFGVVFFVSLGTLFDPRILMESPVLLCTALLAVLVIKAGAATVALRLTRLPWRAAAGMGLGLAHLGELSFVILSEGHHANLISDLHYDRMLFVAIGTLVLTPQLLKAGLRWTRQCPQAGHFVAGGAAHKG